MPRPDGVENRYRPLRLLGEGGSGRVWLVEDGLRPGIPLARKELSGERARVAKHAESFRREFATLACLKHPSLVEVFEFGESPSGVPYFTLEYVEGQNVLDAVATEGPIALLGLTAEALRALAFLHDFDLVHGDLKPDNVLVRDASKLGCRVVLVDFGLARSGSAPAADGAEPRGTLPYMAPELFRGGSPSRRGDLYSLGAVLHEAVFGSPPFPIQGPDVGRFIETVLGGDRARLPLPPGHSDGFERWLSAMLATDPAERPSSASEALARLNETCGTRYDAHTPASRASRISSGPPLERRASLEEIWTALEEASGPRVIWLCGGPGSGKTRILRWLEARAIDLGWSVRAPLPSRPPDLEELRETARAGPTLLLLDDGETATGGLAEVLERVARQASEPPLRIVCAVRPGELRHPSLVRLLDDVGTVPTLRRVDLAPLVADGVGRMAERAAGSAPSQEQVSWLMAASEGTPSIVEALLIEGAWERSARLSPATALGDHGARLDLLSARTLRWMEALAALGGEAGEGTVAALAGLEAADARACGEEAAAAGVAVCRSGAWRPASRALVDQLRNRTAPARATELHRSAAALLESSPGISSWRLCLSWTAAEDPSRALPLAIRAAEESDRDGDPGEAAERYGHALRLLGSRRAEERHRLRLGQGAALSRSGVHAPAVRAFGAAARLAPSPAGRAEALALQALALVHSGRFDRALEVAERAAALASSIGDAAVLAKARKAAGVTLARLGREEEALPLLELARDLLQGSEDEAEILQIIAACKLRLRRDDAERDFLRVLELRIPADGSPASAHALKARIGLAVIEARKGNSQAASTILEGVQREAAAIGNLALAEASLSRLAAVALEEQRLDRAIVLAEQAADLALHLGDRNLLLAGHCRLADAQIRSGRPGDAIALLERTLDGPLGQVEPENVDYARMLLANAEIASGVVDGGRARTLLEEALEGCRGRGKPRALLMALVIEMERRARARSGEPFETVADRLSAEIERADAVEPEIRIRGLLARTLFHSSRGESDRALACASEAAAIARDHGAMAYAAEALAGASEALRSLSREREAAAASEEGKAILTRVAERIESVTVRRAFLERPEFASLSRADSLPHGRQQNRLFAMYEMIRALNSEEDPDALLDTILDMAIEVVRAERGMVLLREEPVESGAFAVRASRNLEAETVRDAESYSRSVVSQAGAGRTLLCLDAGSDERFRDLRSVSLYGIRSLLCVPLRLRGKIIGTVYLDSRREGVLFTPEDLRFLEAFADHAAVALGNAQARARLERQNRRLQVAAESRAEFGNLVGRSPGMQRVFDLIEKVAGTDLPVLVLGESGTGKELVARAIHFQGARKRRMFLSENCAAIPETLLESELFGHVRGAFTGAERDRAGLFEQADGGTLFLDEVGDMSAAMQARLLRVLEEGKIRRVGGEKSIRVDVRVVAATHRDLDAERIAGRFREDLLYRLRVLAIELPPLRRRPGDVELLVSHFVARIARERGRDAPAIHDELLGLFERHPWPGNVRELQNVLQRLVLLAGRRALTVELLESDAELGRTFLRGARAPETALSLKFGEKEQIRRAIAAARGNRRKAAEMLGVSRATLYRKLREHEI